jgi:hypothetical protein
VRWIVFLLAIGGLYLAWTRFSPSAVPLGLPMPPAAATKAPAVSGGAPAGDLAPRAQPDPGRGDVAFEIDQAELSRQLNQQLAGRPLGQTPLGDTVLERIQLSLHAGQAEATGSARLGGASVPVSSQLVPSIDSTGRLAVRVSQATVAGLPVPDLIRADLERSIEAELGRVINRQSLRLRSLEIGDGKLRVIGTPSA